jgi:hypothetical protein
VLRIFAKDNTGNRRIFHPDELGSLSTVELF